MALHQMEIQDNAQAEAQGDRADDVLVWGYPEIADLMRRHPEAMIFRRYTRISMLNILRIQAELQDLERRLDEAISRDRKSKDPVVRNYSNDFYSMRENLAEQDEQDEPRDTEQIEILMEIGQKLQEYNTAVETAQKLSSITAPSPDEVTFLRHRLDRSDGGDSFLVDAERQTWAEKNNVDLMTLYRRPFANDTFTKILKGPLLNRYHRLWGQRRKKATSGYREYSDTKIRETSKTIGTIIASVLPTLTILVLYFVRPALIRIGLVIVFTALFSLALSVFTTAAADGIFTATATFAAVEVVFIGTTTNSTG